MQTTLDLLKEIFNAVSHTFNRYTVGMKVVWCAMLFLTVLQPNILLICYLTVVFLHDLNDTTITKRDEIAFYTLLFYQNEMPKDASLAEARARRLGEHYYKMLMEENWDVIPSFIREKVIKKTITYRF